MRLSALLAVLSLAMPTFAAEPKTNPPQTQPATLSQLEKQLEETLTNADLVGFFTMGDDRPPKAERYTIVSAKKMWGDRWLVTAKFVYGGKEISIPMPLRIPFADDTAVISVTDLTIPGGGTYTARVLIYKNQYAGTWSGGKFSGQLWGKIEKAKPAAAAPAEGAK
jgi:hypothetical protein